MATGGNVTGLPVVLPKLDGSEAPQQASAWQALPAQPLPIGHRNPADFVPGKMRPAPGDLDFLERVTPYAGATVSEWTHEVENIMACTVLVADDSRVMRRIIIRALNDIGLNDVVEAGDGDEALTLFRAQEIALVLTDWNMPNRNGLEVIQGIRATGSTIPIIMITTESEKARVFSAIEAGVSDYLIKPFDAETLRKKLERHMGSLVS